MTAFLIGCKMETVSVSKSLKYSIYDGFFYSLMVGFSETYFSAFAIFLGANNFQLGVLASLPPLMAGLSQFFTFSILSLFSSRKKMVCFFVFLQGLILFPMLLSSQVSGIPLEIYIALVTLYTMSGVLIGPLWNSWIGDLVPPQQRGTFFGKRNRILTVGTFLSMLMAGFVLRHYKEIHYELWGFILVFCTGAFARSMSAYFLSRKMDPIQEHAGTRFRDFLEFVKNIFQRNEGRLILYMASINFAVFTSAAYIAPYLLRTLQFSYATYTLVISGVMLTKFLSSPFWGRVCDKLGTRRVLKVVAFLIPLSTILWAFVGNPVILFFAQCFSGFIWAGYELATFTFLLDAVLPKERARVAMYSSIIVNSSALLGGLTGSAVVLYGPQFLHPFALVFILSGVLRILAFVAFMPHIREVREIAPVRAKDVWLEATGFKSALGLTTRLVVFNTRIIKRSSRLIRPLYLGSRSRRNNLSDKVG